MEDPFTRCGVRSRRGVYGNFAKVKSIAALEEERAKEEGISYQEEECIPQHITVIGRYKSTFGE